MVKSLFGSSSKSSSTQPTGFQSLPGFAQDAFRDAVGAASGFLDDPTIFEAVAPNEQMLAALATLGEGAEGITAERFNNAFDVFNNPFIEQTLDPALADLERVGRSAISDIASQASDAGAFGGQRQALLESEVARNLGQEAGRLSANVRSQGFESAAQKALAQLGQQQTAASNLFNAGDFVRQLQEQTQTAPATAAQFLAQLAAGIPAGGGATSFSRGASPGIVGQLGSLASGGSAAYTAFSDARMKENIKFIRKDGQHNIYRFNYLGDKRTFEGPLAHEVHEVKPEAVGIQGGFLTVDFSKIQPDLVEVAHG